MEDAIAIKAARRRARLLKNSDQRLQRLLGSQSVEKECGAEQKVVVDKKKDLSEVAPLDVVADIQSHLCSSSEKSLHNPTLTTESTPAESRKKALKKKASASLSLNTLLLLIIGGTLHCFLPRIFMLLSVDEVFTSFEVVFLAVEALVWFNIAVVENCNLFPQSEIAVFILNNLKVPDHLKVMFRYAMRIGYALSFVFTHFCIYMTAFLIVHKFIF